MQVGAAEESQPCQLEVPLAWYHAKMEGLQAVEKRGIRADVDPNGAPEEEFLRPENHPNGRTSTELMEIVYAFEKANGSNQA